VLVGPRGAIAVAARVDAPLEPAKVAKDVPTANLEGAGQERVGSTLVVVSATGQRLAAHPLPAGSEVVGVTTTREAIVLAVMRVARGVRSVDVDAVRADGRRERVGTFPVRRAARLYPVAAPSGVPASSSAAAVLEVVDDGVAVLGARAGALPVREVEAVFGAQTEGDSLDVWLLRAREGGRSLVPARCTWRTP
jgi:hypothetical protein